MLGYSLSSGLISGVLLLLCRRTGLVIQFGSASPFGYGWGSFCYCSVHDPGSGAGYGQGHLG